MILGKTIMIGLLLAPLLQATVLAEDAPLYDRIKASVEKELAIGGAEPELIDFLLAVYGERWEMTEDDVEAILRGEGGHVCGEQERDSPAKNSAGCAELLTRLPKLAEEEQHIRTLGRELQAIASSYELPIADLPDRSLTLASDLRGILTIWSAGTGSVRSSSPSPVIRTATAERVERYRGDLEELRDALEELSREQRIAAVWRYQYGVRLFNDRRAPRFPSPHEFEENGVGTEGQYLNWRWGPVESALLDLWETIRTTDIDPPLGTNETVYVSFPQELYGDLLPENILLWARLDGNAEEEHPLGDVGLQWRMPIEPVLPSLLKEGDEPEPIPGGEYPPEPVVEEDGETVPADGRGLCTSPVALRSYLCRGMTPNEEEGCPEDADTGTGAIRLINCTHTGSVQRFTQASADVCREVQWKESAAFNPQRECRVALRCADECDGGPHFAYTFPKSDEGVIEICIETGAGDIANPSYILVHELAHAYQHCNEPPTDDLYEGLSRDQATIACCQMEGEAYRMQCDMMERDGLFEGLTAEGMPLTAEACAEIGASRGCQQVEVDGERLGSCHESDAYSDGFVEAMLSAIRANPKELPDACSEAIDLETMEPRARQFLELIENEHDVCEPGQVNVYQNRIGNNACYIGQCVEQTVELHRVTGGAAPVATQGMAFPWDDPLQGSPLGNAVMHTDTPRTAPLPPYNPTLLVQQMETALCQLQGLPALTPHVLCAIQAGRQTDFKRVFGLETAMGVLIQEQESAISEQDLLSLSPALGARAGSELYARYLEQSSRSFAQLVTTAAQLLEELKDIDFPTEMCPLEPEPPASPDDES